MIWRKSIGAVAVRMIAERLRFEQGSVERGSAMASEAKTDLEQELGALLEVERFEPPEEFRAAGALERPRGLRGGRCRSGGLVAAAGDRAARLGRGRRASASTSRTPLLQVVRRRQAERLGQLPRPPRRSGQGRPGRLPLARRGGRGARRHLRRAARRHPALRQRSARPRDRQGRRGRDLPADDPAGRRRDARLRPDRRHPQRRLRRLLGRGGTRADGVLRSQGAGHRRRRPPQGQDGAGEGAGRRGARRASSRSRRSSSSATPGPSARWSEGRDVWFERGVRRRRRRVRAGADGRRGPALHPLHLRLDREAEGDPAHHRRLPDRRRLSPIATSSTSSPRRTSTGARPTSAGSPATPTSSTGRSPTGRRA